MNRDKIAEKWQGVKWQEIRGKAERIWAELTDDDFKRAEGSVDKLYGVIQKKFGDSKEMIKRKLDLLHM